MYLYVSPCLFAERVIMFELHSHGLVTIHSRHLYIRGVVHVDGTEEVCSSEACRKTDGKCKYLQLCLWLKNT